MKSLRSKAEVSRGGDIHSRCRMWRCNIRDRRVVLRWRRIFFISGGNNGEDVVGNK